MGVLDGRNQSDGRFGWAFWMGEIGWAFRIGLPIDSMGVLDGRFGWARLDGRDQMSVLDGGFELVFQSIQWAFWMDVIGLARSDRRSGLVFQSIQWAFWMGAIGWAFRIGLPINLYPGKLYAKSWCRIYTSLHTACI